MSKVEEVARAICLRSVGDTYDGWLEDHRHLALAAIEAMREPTDAMAAVAYQSVDKPVIQLWDAMIDAALLERQS